ncbi:dynein axonemal heavy chain 6-like [Leptopilina heterotoma]|uniref:dynein axonemal heavy chain 6-like n=1 Tax=Leptopilina heterotoma TaxID=63436 RepID=UPI001CA85506|nr:dynein axonemal heavy chain 6-like [Leptopilina heterotoma]
MNENKNKKSYKRISPHQGNNEDNLKIRKKKNTKSIQDDSNNEKNDQFFSQTNLTNQSEQIDEIPFHKPHKKLLETLEEKKEFPEPLNQVKNKETMKSTIHLAEREKKDEDYSSLNGHSWQKTVSIQVKPKGKVLLDDQKIDENKKSQPPKIADQLELIRKLTTDSSIDFYYMIYAVERSSKFFTPYAFKLVPYEEISKTFMTISANGVTKYSPDEMIFTPIELWEREYKDYMKIAKIKTFTIFSKWKAFYVWRKSISWRKFNAARDYLMENLFVSHSILSETLLEINTMCMQFLHVSLVDTSVFEKLPLFLFTEIQFAKLEDIRSKLDSFRETTAKLVRDACLKTLLEAGYTPDDSNITIEQTEFGQLGRFAGTKFKMPKDGILKMSHIEQARKREKCYRLSCFIQLIDYLQTNMMQNLLYNTYKILLDTLQESCPYFVVDLVISLEFGIALDPSEEIFWHVIKTIQSMWEENLFEIKPFLSDPFFDIFTRPMINHKIENRISGKPPEILTIINNDCPMNDLKRKFEDILIENFQIVRQFSRKFSEIEKFFHEDMNENEVIIRENEECSIFRELCARYQSEIKIISQVEEDEISGIFFIKLGRFKFLSLPAPTQKWIVIEKVIPSLGKKRVDALLNEADEAINYLDTNPVTTDDFVAYINFVDQAQNNVNRMEVELEYVKEIYDIMEEYQIPVPAMDAVNYSGISDQFKVLCSAVNKKLEHREKLIGKFNVQIQKDIDVVINKITDINDEATVPIVVVGR